MTTPSPLTGFGKFLISAIPHFEIAGPYGSDMARKVDMDQLVSAREIAARLGSERTPYVHDLRRGRSVVEVNAPGRASAGRSGE